MTVQEANNSSEQSIYWRTQVTPENLMGCIDTESARQGKWVPTLLNELFPRPHVLDFGCGIGRNIAPIQYMFGDRVVGYDFSERLSQMDKDVQSKYVLVTSDWQYLCKLDIDIVVAVHVFQHMGVPVLEQTLQDLRNYHPHHRLYVQTRWWMDDKLYPVADILNRYYDNVPYRPEGGKDIEYHWHAVCFPKRTV